MKGRDWITEGLMLLLLAMPLLFWALAAWLI